MENTIILSTLVLPPPLELQSLQASRLPQFSGAVTVGFWYPAFPICHCPHTAALASRAAPTQPRSRSPALFFVGSRSPGCVLWPSLHKAQGRSSHPLVLFFPSCLGSSALLNTGSQPCGSLELPSPPCPSARGQPLPLTSHSCACRLGIGSPSAGPRATS